jgi:hypothetical protein
MEEKSGAKDIMGAGVESKREMLLRAIAGSRWNFECYDKYGNLKWAELDRPNIITNEGLNAWLDIMFHEATQIATWYIFPVETDTTAAVTMTYAVPVFTEWDGYSEATRQAFVEAAASSQSITNSASKAVYTSTEAKTLYGGALVGGGTDADTKNDTAGGGTLFCYSKFSAGKPVENTDTFKIYCTISIANAA